MDGNDAARKQERKTTMNKVIITAVAAAVALGSLAKGRMKGPLEKISIVLSFRSQSDIIVRNNAVTKNVKSIIQ